MIQAISFLQRNGFTKIVEVDIDHLTANDGSRKVLVYLDLNDLPDDAGPCDCSVPDSFITKARDLNRRLDVVTFRVKDTDKISVRWFMNTVEVI